ncbi:MAG TPA: antibiotic biosynthesis monooxygenase, partial [Ideonella sp.]|nr:antibiotic biosynthesis monooxygenase [Ideonella sp.]
MTSRFAPRPTPPYYAVIFTSQRSEADEAGYGAMAERMAELAAQ